VEKKSKKGRKDKTKVKQEEKNNTMLATLNGF
jgi:hypothetical protein